jgi:hypothetical protein
LTGKLAQSFKYHLCKGVVRKENEANHMEKVHKDDSSDPGYMVEKVPSYKIKMGVGTVKKRKHEILGETGEIDEVPADRDTIMGNTTHGDSAIVDNVEYGPVEQWPSEVPKVSETKENRSLEGQDEINQDTSDNKNKGKNIPKEKMDVGRNDEEEFVPNADINKEMDVRQDDKPLETDDTSEDDEKEEADDEPYTGPGVQYDKSGYAPPIGDTASENHDEVGTVHKSDTEAENMSTKGGGPHEDPIEGIDNTEAHDGNYVTEHVSKPTHQNSKMSFMAAQDNRDTDTTTMLHMKPSSSSTPMSQEATCPPTTRNFGHAYANMPRVNTSTLLNKDVHLKEMLVAQLALIQRQAARDKKQIREELFGLKNRIKWLENRAL